MQQAIERLELSEVRAALATRTTTPLGDARAHALSPFAERKDATAQIERVSEARRLLENEAEAPVAGGHDCTQALELGEKGIVLDSIQLREIAYTMEAGTKLQRFLLAHEDTAPLLYGLGAGLSDLGRVADEVLRSFEPSGRLADDASDALGPLRQRLRSLQGGMEEKLNELMGSERISKILQEPYFTMRANRYVLPIKASYQGRVKGIVHDASGSGQTVFIEPQEIVEHGNRVKIAQSEVEEEEARILGELTLLVVAEAEAVRHAMTVIADVDLIVAKARLALDLDCEAIVPASEPGFDLIAARHPQLVLQKLADKTARLVANDIGLDDEQRILILTGPNTGGKTVTMKTVGLCALMVRCGLHIPCDKKSKIGWFDTIQVAIGDDQSIASKLSTFAAHVKQLSEVVSESTAKTLVLVDEIAADTDPTQGQALAQAVLEAIADKRAHAIVTTHFEGLKAIPFADPRFRNAGVGFDPERFLPTYRISLDVPQSSNGFDIAQSLGLPESIVQRARDLTGEGSVAIEEFMKSLQSKAVELDDATARAEKAEARATAAEAKLETKIKELEDERKAVIEGARAELIDEIERTRNEVRQMIAKLQNAASSEAVSQAMRDANEIASRLASVEEEQVEKTQPSAPKTAGSPLDAIEVGDWVHIPRLSKDGTVVAVDGRDAVIAVGNMRTRVPTKSLRAANTKAPKKGPQAERFKKPRSDSRTGSTTVVITSSEEIDVRGLATDEGLSRLDGFLDHHYGGSTTHVRVIHGHGTGALRAAIRSHLKRSGYVKSFRPGDEKEGGDGATVVELA